MSRVMEESHAELAAMEEDILEVDQLNNSDLTRNAVTLQSQLNQLRLKMMTARSELTARNTPNLYANNVDLYTKVSTADLNNLTRERTQTFLNFTSLQRALTASQASQVLTAALNLDKDSNMVLEPEEETYVRELLEEQRELSLEVIKAQNIGAKQELEILEKRSKLAQLYCRYKELREEVGPLDWNKIHNKGKGFEELEKELHQDDYRLNQIRFMVQRLMMSQPNLGKGLDEETNQRFHNMFQRCGMRPEEMRREMLENNQE